MSQKMLKELAKRVDDLRDDDNLDNDHPLWVAGYEAAVVRAGNLVRAALAWVEPEERSDS